VGNSIHGYTVLPDERAPVERPQAGKRVSRNELMRYKPFGEHDGFLEVYSPDALHHVILRNDRFRGFDQNGLPILVNIPEYRPKDELVSRNLRIFHRNLKTSIR